jgi:DAACS family dicarboxylate/amino acid:cation (Na+ or H+) symporter
MLTSRVSLTSQILVGMLLGAVVGTIFGTAVAPIGEIGRLLIQAIRVFATPLLFFAILHAVMTTRVEGRHAGRMLGVAFLNGSIALAIGLILSNTLRVGDRLAPLFAAASDSSLAPIAEPPRIEFGRFLSTFVPTSVVQPFVDNIAVTVIFLALLLGFALRRLGNEPPVAPLVASAEGAARLGLRVTEIILGWIIMFIPLAVFSVVAQAVGRSGIETLRSLGYYVALGLLGLSVHVLITHHAWILYLRRSVRDFWRAARAPVVYAMGSNSSLATLPLTLNALDGLKVSRTSSTLGACVGTNFNNDGVLLYEAMAALMVAQALGIELDLGAQLVVAFLSMIAAMGIAGVPEAGFISLAVVLTTLGLPLEALPLLLTVDWIIARGRSVVNVLSDMVVSLAIEGRQAAVNHPELSGGPVA